MDNNTKKNLIIFSKYLNNNNKLISLNIENSYVGKKKYFPPQSKEWKNSVYAFNHNNIKNLPVYDMNINELIKNYFNLYLNPKFIFNKKKLRKHRYLSLNKIYVSKAEIKHTNNKAILTVYVYNREKISLLKKIKFIKKSFFKLIKSWISYKKLISSVGYTNILYNNLLYKKGIKVALYKELILLRKYKLRLNYNKYKFEEKLLFKLNNLIIKFYNKKVEFNIVNMKSIILNSEFFTKLLTLKLKNRKVNILKMMNIILNRAVLPKINRIIETSRIIKSVDLNLLENKFKNFYISSILRNNNLSELLNSLYYNVVLNNNSNNHLNKNYAKIYEIIFNSINYKNLGGIRLEAKGRLTKRNRADRALFKVKWKGGLKNIDSSFKGLSSVTMRGYQKANIDYSLYTSKRRIGAFAVKGWISGK